jgi:hypothetical protein
MAAGGKMNDDIFRLLAAAEWDDRAWEKRREEWRAANRAKFDAQYGESLAAYQCGVTTAESWLEFLSYAYRILDSDEYFWIDAGLPPLSWQFLRGLVDTLHPVFENTSNAIETLATSGLLRGRMKKKAPAIIRKVLRQTILDDLRQHQKENFEQARSKRPDFDPYSKEW